MLWKRWKRGTTRYRELVRLGSTTGTSRTGSSWEKSLAHVPNTCDKRSPEQRLFGRTQGWKALQNDINNCVILDEPPDADPHVRWCERGRLVAAPYSIAGYVVLYFAIENWMISTWV